MHEDESQKRRIDDLTQLNIDVEGLKKSMKHIFDAVETLASKFDNYKQPPDIKTIIYVILSTIAILSSAVGVILWIINSQVQVPLEQIKSIKTEISIMSEKNNHMVSNVQILTNNIQTLNERVKDNTAFVNQYMYIDKIPVSQERQNGKLEMLEKQMSRITDTIHQGKTFRKE